MLRFSSQMENTSKLHWAGLILVMGCGLSACADGTNQHACVTQVVGDLVTSAQMFRLDVYGSGVACNGNSPAKGAVAEETRTYTVGQPINLDVSPGHRTLVLTTYADTNAKLPTGSACSAQQLSPGGKACFNLKVTAYCDPTSVHCGDLCCTGNNGACDASCVLTCDGGFGDCNGQLSDGCETNLAAASLKVCGSACIAADSCCSDADCTAPPTPVACYAGTCPGAGGTCDYGLKSTATVCGNTCCNSTGGTCSSSCVVTCATGFSDCNNSPGDGCESNTATDPLNCGGCGRACAVGQDNVKTPVCSNDLCTSECEPGWSNCNQPVAPDPDDGCEAHSPGCCGPNGQTPHDNGVGQTFYDCSAQGSLNATQATEAALAYNPQGNVTEGDIGSSPDFDNAKCVIDATNTYCVCWVYASGGMYNSAKGHLAKSDPRAPGDLAPGCVLPLTSSGFPAWD
jgi:hypothetical protein